MRFFFSLAVMVSLLGVFGARAAASQQAAARADAASLSATLNATVAGLYHRLESLPVDAQRVYRIDGMDIDDEDVHISLVHGTLGLLESVDGEVTGAMFEGHGEIVVMPPDIANRISLTNFTGLAVLSEQFTTAYFRFTDGALRVDAAEIANAMPGADFAARWREPVSHLNPHQTLRVMAEFLNGRRTPFLFARLAGTHLGVFDVLVDRSLPEQVIVARSTTTLRGTFEDIWCSFPMRTVRLGKTTATVDNIAPASYRVTTHIHDDLSLEGVTEARFRAAASGDRVLIFNLAPTLQLQSVKEDGISLPFVQNEQLHAGAGKQLADVAAEHSNFVALILPAPLEKGRDHQLTFNYSGEIIQDAGNGLYGVEERADWYPHHNFLPAMQDLTFIYPAQLTLIATGHEIAAAPGTAGAGERASQWVSDKPLSLAGFNLGQYREAVTRTHDPRPVTVEVYAPTGAPIEAGPKLSPTSGAPRGQPAAIDAAPTERQQRLDEIGADTVRAIEFFEARYGAFPYQRLALTQLPYHFGQGWPGLLFLATYSFLAPQEMESLKLSPDVRVLYTALMRPHEIAHQWWGDAVAWKDYHDQWLSEALANYSALLYLQSRPETADAFNRVLEHYRLELVRPDKAGKRGYEAGPVRLGLRLNSSRFPNGYDLITYGKGTWIFHMLRELLRDPADGSADDSDARFFHVLRTFRARFEGQAPSTADFQKVVEQSLPQRLNLTQDGSLDWFFREWLDWAAIPKYSFEGVRWTKAARGGRTVQGTLVQSEVSEDFIMPVPLYVSDGKQRTLLGTVVADGPDTHFHFRTTAPGKTLLIDPDGTVLKQ